jgi:hypothetical protein
VPWYGYSVTPAGGKPFVQVRLWHGARQVELLALVDSGADMSALDAGYADLLGLDRADAVADAFTTAGGGTATCLSWPNAPLEMQFERDRFPFAGVFVEFGPDADPINLLGRKDFFERYIIQFWDAAELMNIDTSPDYPRPVPNA